MLPAKAATTTKNISTVNTYVLVCHGLLGLIAEPLLRQRSLLSNGFVFRVIAHIHLLEFHDYIFTEGNL